MASITKRRNADGSISRDAMLRVAAYSTTSKSSHPKPGAELRAARTPARAKGGTLVSARRMIFAKLPDDVPILADGGASSTRRMLASRDVPQRDQLTVHRCIVLLIGNPAEAGLPWAD